MSRRLLAFLLAELKIVRVVCPRPSCGAVTEVTVEHLGTRFADSHPFCPVCRQEFAGLGPGAAGPKNPLVRLSEAILEIQGEGRQAKPGVQIEFVLPDPGA